MQDTSFKRKKGRWVTSDGFERSSVDPCQILTLQKEKGNYKTKLLKVKNKIFYQS